MSEFVAITDAIGEAFREEVAQLGGRVTECLNDGERLFGRSVLKHSIDVGPQDGVEGGVAIRFGESRLRVQPYTFRLVCRNGAIFAHADEALSIEVPDYVDTAWVRAPVREGVRACASDQALRRCTRAMEESRRVRAEPTMWLMVLERMGRLTMAESRSVLSRFDKGKDPSRFGLLNAMTSLARDTSDPGRRSDLEELGGSLVVPPATPPPRLAPDRRSRVSAA